MLGFVDIVEDLGGKGADAAIVGLSTWTEVGKQEADIVAQRAVEAILDHILSPEWEKGYLSMYF